MNEVPWRSFICPIPTVLGNGRDWKIVAQYGTNTSSKCPYVLPPSRSQTDCLSCFALPHYGVGTESAANRLWLSLPLTTLTTRGSGAVVSAAARCPLAILRKMGTLVNMDRAMVAMDVLCSAQTSLRCG